MKYLQSGFALTLLMCLALAVWAQQFNRQGITFSLVDQSGEPISGEVLANGDVKVYSLREAKVAKDQQLVYHPEKQRFTFTESVVSPGLSLAFVSATDTMFLSVFGRSGPDRVIDSLQIRKGSYVLTSNEFSGKYLKVSNWDKYLEEEVPAAKQDLSSYIFQLKDKKPVSLVQGSAN
ncbi:MAG: hypothetical protein ACO1NZ_16085 [Adhaeribacter sp.]